MSKEINKYLKRLSAEKLRKNHKECIELYNLIGGMYSDLGSYDEAAHYHEQALVLCKTIGDRLGTASAFRFIGEAKAALGDFSQAISHTKRYLDLAQKINDKVEIQRAWTTLGRVYLMQAQDMKEKMTSATDKGIKEVAREAERRFQTALTLAESVRDQVDAKEYAQMTSGLLMNLGLIHDICDQHREAVIKYKRAIEICRASKLKEDLFRCLMCMASILRQRDNIKDAIRVSEEALHTAKSIGKKVHICDALIERGLVRICQRDFKNAKRTFAQAYLEKSPVEEEHIKAIRYTKLSHLIASAHERISKDTSASETRMKLCDKLGDLFIEIENYKLAIEFYRRAYADAKACGRPKGELALILYSLAETYADSRQYQHALACYEKELKYRGDNKTEQCHSMIKIAHMLEYLEKDPKETCDQYEKALNTADNDPKLMYNVLKYYVPYLKANSDGRARCKELEDLLMKLESYPEVEEDTNEESNNVGIDLDDEIANIEDIITDDEDNDEVLMIGRRRAKGKSKFKQNEVGDTPLHEACIKGDFKRVKSLIGQGHEVNPRDNAGWIPLHEACNHGHYQIAEYLLDNGADVNNRGVKGLSPLHDAASNGHFDIMRLLLKNGANAISLTDTGETVLSCLRDYKNRCYKEMSNSELMEYKQMEAELLNVMDKCGFNLMTENIKTLGARGSAGPSALTSTGTSRPLVRPQTSAAATLFDRDSNISQANSKPKSLSVAMRGTSRSSSIMEYRDAIGTLKRKRPLEISQPNKRASQPATIQTTMNTSVSTKQWLLNDDDILEEEEVDDEEPEFLEERKNGSSKDKRSSDNNGGIQSKWISDDEDDIQFLDKDGQVMKSANCENSHEKEIPSQLEPIEEDVDLPPMSPRLPARRTFESNSARVSKSPAIFDNVSQGTFSIGSSSNFSTNTSYDLFNKPLLVMIDERKLMIPIKDELITVGDLKKMVVDRYSILVNARPKISLAPQSDINCMLFDGDLCRDVVRESLVASVESWQLKSIEETYVDECAKHRLEPIDFVKVELRALEEAGTKLDLSYVRFPSAHRPVIYAALSRREFTTATFQGSVSLFEQSNHKIASPAGPLRPTDLLVSIITWNKLTRLNLKCTGLLKSHFEYLCGARSRLPELQTLDVSFNCIVYKHKREFSTQVQQLLLACPKLRRLDVRKNHLQFIQSIISAITQSEHTNGSPIQQNIGHCEVDMAKALGISSVEILGADQCDYSIYSTV